MSARRLAVARQRLAAPRNVGATTDDLLDVIRDLGCLQLDPISVVARSHLLVLSSRVGPFDTALMDSLLWDERRVFEYWAHAASIVLTEDYPIHNLLMRRYPTDRYEHSRRMRTWVEENAALRRSIVRRLRAEGPMRGRDLDDESRVGWVSSGWTAGRNVERMLDYLWTRGEIMVVGRPGGLKLWDLAERWLPDWTPRTRLSDPQVHRLAAERSLRALGVGTLKHVNEHFTRSRYRELPAILAGLARRKRIHAVRVVQDGSEWPGGWYVHDDDLALLERLERGEAWEPRTTLLSPFDNLICDRARTERLFGFTFRMEIYVPKAKRRFGYYVLPILHGDRLIGRIDPAFDRRERRLAINAVHAEPDAPMDAATGRAVADAIRDLAAFLGATDMGFGEVPAAWRRALLA